MKELDTVAPAWPKLRFQGIFCPPTCCWVSRTHVTLPSLVTTDWTQCGCGNQQWLAWGLAREQESLMWTGTKRTPKPIRASLWEIWTRDQKEIVGWCWVPVLKGQVKLGQGVLFWDYVLAEYIRNWDAEKPVRRERERGASEDPTKSREIMREWGSERANPWFLPLRGLIQCFLVSLETSVYPATILCFTELVRVGFWSFPSKELGLSPDQR